MASSKQVRVVHLVSTLNFGGLEKVVYDLVRLSDRERFDVEVICLGEVGTLAEDFDRLGVATTALDAMGEGALAISKKLAPLLKGVDVLHTHNPGPHLAGVLARFRTRVPVLVHTKHGRNYPDQWKKVLINRLIAWRTDAVVAVSNDAARVSLDVERIPAGKIRVIHNGIDLTKFSPSPKYVPNPLRAIHVARICDPPKDHTTLLQATRRVVDFVPEFHLEIVGDGPDRARMEALCDKLQLRGNVTFSGFCSDVAERIGRSGLALLSSLTEGLSITLLEAMAMGLPVVATDVGGNGEVVTHGQTGLLVTPQQPEAMAAAILEFIRMPEGAAAMGRAGRERVESHFNLETVARKYEELYLSFLPGSRIGQIKPRELAHA